MPLVTYDTNVFIRHHPAYFPAGFRMSAVVLQELTAGAKDAREVRMLDPRHAGSMKVKDASWYLQVKTGGRLERC